MKILIIILLSLTYLIDGRINYFNCKDYQPWPVNVTSAAAVAQARDMLQTWLFARQHSQWRCSMAGIDVYSAQGGIGNGYLRAAAVMERAIRHGKIYRPTKSYYWASNAVGCTYNKPYFDCYTKEFSGCGLVTPYMLHPPSIVPLDQDDRTTELGKMLNTDGGVNVCMIAQALQKPTVWVAGQYLKYVMRLRDDIQQQVDQRVNGIFTDVKQPYSTITVHYRGGIPDMDRKVYSLDVYMEAVRLKAHELELQGRPVAVVNLASQDNERIFHNASYMHDRYGGKYDFKFLPALTSGVDKSREIELELTAHPEVPRQPFVVEFIADLKLMVEADVYIGSLSSIYMLTMLLRYANNPGLHKPFTCMINHREKLICEDDEFAMREIYNMTDYWRTADKTKFNHAPEHQKETSYGAFQGGTPF
jgi:hypothetical protein